MRRLGWLAALVLGSSAAEAASAEDRVVIAVFPLQDTAEVLSPKAERSLTDYFGVKLAESGQFIIVPRADLEAALKQQKAASYEACYDQRCQIEIGKELAAQKVVHTQVVKVGDSCAVASTLFDLRMGAAESAASERGGCGENELVVSIEKVAQRLSASAGPPPAIANPAPKSAPPPTAPAGPTFSLRVTSDPPTADVLVDGRRKGTGVGVSVPLEPDKSYELTVEAEGFVSHREQVTLERDGRRVIELVMTPQARADRDEWFGLSLGGGLTPSGTWSLGLWLRAIHLTFGDFRWVALETYFGYLSGKRSYAGSSAEFECTATELTTDGYCRRGSTGFALFAGSRVGWSFALDEAGDRRLEVGLAPGIMALTETDDARTSVAVAPLVQYLSFTEGSLAWGVALRALVPLTYDSCRLGGNVDGDWSSARDFTRCQNSNPVLFQLEMPLGWYL